MGGQGGWVSRSGPVVDLATTCSLSPVTTRPRRSSWRDRTELDKRRALCFTLMAFCQQMRRHFSLVLDDGVRKTWLMIATTLLRVGDSTRSAFPRPCTCGHSRPECDSVNTPRLLSSATHPPAVSVDCCAYRSVPQYHDPRY